MLRRAIRMFARCDRTPHLSPSGSAVRTYTLPLLRIAAAACHPIFRPRAREGLILRSLMSFVVTTMFLSCQAFSPKLCYETHLSLTVVLVPRCLYPLGKKCDSMLHFILYLIKIA